MGPTTSVDNSFSKLLSREVSVTEWINSIPFQLFFVSTSRPSQRYRLSVSKELMEWKQGLRPAQRRPTDAKTGQSRA